MVTQVNMHEAKTQLSALVERALSGERVVIARAGTPVVDLVPHSRVTVVFGLGRGSSSSMLRSLTRRMPRYRNCSMVQRCDPA
ncbi:type II toxin-antitoxin system Phd/YefM family antitoxin [Leucobacter insecticola]|uniref:type II toxin-antitoxin system Phd/YefM family antitoxin n=1 Tax=Leucobacter insecticola TaxID=2714934 RepID=UPI001980B2BE|nr:type II toxin-antitoxin system prevent-host-death family antitoxin [Leucobacter insecticola]